VVVLKEPTGSLLESMPFVVVAMGSDCGAAASIKLDREDDNDGVDELSGFSGVLLRRLNSRQREGKTSRKHKLRVK
jgi:hypothetical protein